MSWTFAFKTGPPPSLADVFQREQRRQLDEEDEWERQPPTNEAEAQRRADALHLRGRTQLAGAASEAAEVQPARQGEMAAAAASCTALQPTQEAAAAGSKRAVNLQRLRMRRQQKWQSSDRCGSTQACGVGQQSHERQRHDHASEDERENVLPPAPVAQPLRKVHLAAEQMPGTAAASAAGLAGPAAASAAGMAGPAAASASDQEDEAEEAASSATLFAFQPRAVVAAAAAQEGAADGQGHPSAASDAAAAPDWAAAYQAFSTVDAAKQLEFVQEQHGKVRTTLAAGLVAGLAYQVDHAYTTTEWLAPADDSSWRPLQTMAKKMGALLGTQSKGYNWLTRRAGKGGPRTNLLLLRQAVEAAAAEARRRAQAST